MPMADFFLPDAKKRVADAVKDVEAKTAAEVVVAVRRRCGNYRHVDMFVGAVLAFVTLLVLLFHPLEFSVDWMPVNVFFAFVVGYYLSASLPPVRRAFASRALMDQQVHVASRAAFYDMGISQTRGRTGVLVFVSFFERRVIVVPDTGIHVAELGPAWEKALSALQTSVQTVPDLPSFLAAVRLLAAPLADALPIQPDDINELPDEPAFA